MVISYSYMVLKKSRYNVPSEIRMHDTKLRRKTENRIHNSVRPGPRTLDSDLKSGSKSMDSEWSWKKLPFILEMEGQIHDDEIGKAQSKINSALQSSLQAGFSLFETNLETDQLQHVATKQRPGQLQSPALRWAVNILIFRVDFELLFNLLILMWISM